MYALCRIEKECVCEREKRICVYVRMCAGERESEGGCVCVREREREGEREERKKENERE